MPHFLTFCLIIILTSCSNPKKDINQSKNISQLEILDSIQPEKNKLELDEHKIYIEEQDPISIADTDIKLKYGKQWDFCDCILKTDSIDNAIKQSDDLSDLDIEKLFNRLDVIDVHCKSLITAPNTTPEDRKKHKMKVNNCKKELGI